MTDSKTPRNADDVAAIDQLRELYGRMRQEIGKVVPLLMDAPNVEDFEIVVHV